MNRGPKFSCLALGVRTRRRSLHRNRERLDIGERCSGVDTLESPVETYAGAIHADLRSERAAFFLLVPDDTSETVKYFMDLNRQYLELILQD